jgi:hypothetical protein
VKLFTAALALALIFSASGRAADIAQLMSPISGMKGIEVSGIIGADDWKKLEELANKMGDYDHTLVVLRSPGGNAVGVAMGDFIHKTGMVLAYALSSQLSHRFPWRLQCCGGSRS